MRDKIERHYRKCPSDKNVFEGQSRLFIENVPRDKTRDRDKVEGQIRMCLSKMSLGTRDKLSKMSLSL